MKKEFSLREKIEEEVKRLKNMLEDFVDDKYYVGKIQGLRKAEDLFAEAVKKLKDYLESIEFYNNKFSDGCECRQRIEEKIDAIFGKELTE